MISFIFWAIALAFVLAFVVSACRTAKTCSQEIHASSPALASNVVELVSPALRSCLRTTSSLPKSKSVRFVTLDSDTDSDLVSVRYYDLHHSKDLRPVSSHGNTPHIPGSKCGLVYPDGSIKMVKHLGTYYAPSTISKRRPRCKTLRHFQECFDCRRAPVERNTWLCGEVRPALAVAIAKNTPVFQVPVASASGPSPAVVQRPPPTRIRPYRIYTVPEGSESSHSVSSSQVIYLLTYFSLSGPRTTASTYLKTVAAPEKARPVFLFARPSPLRFHLTPSHHTYLDQSAAPEKAQVSISPP
ncbi:hypothetical protein BKA64DRAFT_708119 [Cadophora sp. MPI-SDFR-AT-0126]|nr:hypothetical protein BKA64DRAFT_708119 [Leotiomycetes sp. MPI-SDFR-AT-0126]